MFLLSHLVELLFCFVINLIFFVAFCSFVTNVVNYEQQHGIGEQEKEAELEAELEAGS